MLTDPEVYFFSNSWWQELVWKSGRRIADINQSTWSSTIKRVFWMRAVWKGLSKDVFSCATQTCAFNREAAQLWKVRKEIHTAESARDSPSQTLADPWKERNFPALLVERASEISQRTIWSMRKSNHLPVKYADKDSQSKEVYTCTRGCTRAKNHTDVTPVESVSPWVAPLNYHKRIHSNDRPINAATAIRASIP